MVGILMPGSMLANAVFTINAGFLHQLGRVLQC
jgi:hypothetical protein